MEGMMIVIITKMVALQQEKDLELISPVVLGHLVEEKMEN